MNGVGSRHRTETNPGGPAAPETRAEDVSPYNDAWMDELAADRASGARTTASGFLSGTLAGPWHRLRRLLSFLATTPGKMVAITVVMSVAIGAAGYSMSQSAANRQEGLGVLLSATEPLSYSTHNLYSNLSLADTIATTNFVQPGVGDADRLEDYHAAIERATLAATEAAVGIPADEERLRELVAQVQRELPVYTGLVETARANNRVGNPVGITYMANASALMRERILPTAADLFTTTSDRVGEQQQELTQPQWVPLSGLFAAIGFLLLAQWWLWRITRRRLNRGFAAAALAMVVATGWVAGSNFVNWQAGTRSFEQAAQPWDSLTTSRIQAQQARTTETLALVRRESVTQSTQSFNSTVFTVNLALDSYAEAPNADEATVAQARSALTDWQNSHNRFTEALDDGNYDEALRLSNSALQRPGEAPTAAGSYARLDRALAELIDDARATMREFVQEGAGANRSVAAVVLVLALIAVLSVWLGIRPRLQEYL